MSLFAICSILAHEGGPNALVGTSYGNYSLANFAPNFGVTMGDTEGSTTYKGGERSDFSDSFRRQQLNHDCLSFSLSKVIHS